MPWQVSISRERIDVSFGQKYKGFYPLMPTPFCQVCSCPLENGRCRRSADHSKFLRKTYAIGWYNKLRSGSSDLLSRHIYNLKHYAAKAEPLGLAIGELIKNRDTELKGCDCIIPMPQHPDEMHVDKYSGDEFNHVDVLADRLSESVGIRKLDALGKTRPQSMQNLDANQRWAATEGLYELKRDVRGMNVLMLDDVTTTSSNLSRCAEAVINGKASQVSAYVCGINHLI